MNDDHTIRCPACLAEYSRNDAPAEYLRVLHILDPRERSACELQQSRLARLARLSAEVLANPGKLPSMSKEEEDELRANLELKDLTVEQQEQVDAYLNSVKGMGVKFYPMTIMEHIHGEFLKGQQERQQTTTLEQGELRANLMGAGNAGWPVTQASDLCQEDRESIKNYMAAQMANSNQGSIQCTLLEQVCLGLQELGVDCSFTALTIKVELVEKDCSLLFSHGAVTWEGFGYFAPLAHWVSDVPNSCCDVPRITKAIFGWLKRFDYREYRGPAK